MLSPPITLYYSEEGTHSSILSGLLTVIVYVIVFVAAVYYMLNFIERKSPKAYFFNKYTEDAGTFPVNASSMFNFIQIVNTESNEPIPFPFDAFKVIGFDDAYNEDYMTTPTNEFIASKDHWIYGNCNNDSDTEGISELINFQYFEQSACIRKYYDHETKNYYNTDQPGFRWPIIEKGCSNPERTYYGIIIQRCDKAPSKLKEVEEPSKCIENIDKVISEVSLNYQIINHFADMLNYDKPFTKIFQSITSAITDKNYISQNLNFNPANLYTYNGYFFENKVEEISYIFTQNDKQTIDETSGKNTNGCLIAIYFWMQNTLQHYERSYDRIQDILSDIGGVTSIIITFAYGINLLVNNFVVLMDTGKFITDIEQENYSRRDIQGRPSIFRRANNIMNPPRKPYSTQKPQSNMDEEPMSSNYQKLMKDGINLFQMPRINEEKSEYYMNRNTKRNNMYNNGVNNRGYNDFYYSNKPQYNNFKVREKQGNFNKNYSDVISNARKDITYSTNRREESVEYSEKSTMSLFCDYISFLIHLGKNNPTYSYYESFRGKLISEENIIQSYLDLCRLFKIHNLQKKSLFDKNKE